MQKRKSGPHSGGCRQRATNRCLLVIAVPFTHAWGRFRSQRDQLLHWPGTHAVQAEHAEGLRSPPSIRLPLFISRRWFSIALGCLQSCRRSSSLGCFSSLDPMTDVVPGEGVVEETSLSHPPTSCTNARSLLIAYHCWCENSVISVAVSYLKEGSPFPAPGGVWEAERLHLAAQSIIFLPALSQLCGVL